MDEVELSEELLGPEIDAILSSFSPEELKTLNAAPLDKTRSLEEKDETPSHKDEKEEGSKAKELKAQELERKREGNRRRCRKFRERRREEEKQVFQENLQLKRERSEFLDTISDLEYTVQTLRGQGVLDLTKENELLRQEIKKHRVYIERVVETVVNTPLETTNVENTRMMTSAAESTVSQAIGLIYSSMNESTWNKANILEVDPGDGAPLQKVFPRWQLLPIGSSWKDARRVNIRTDFRDVPVESSELADYFWSVASRIDVLQAKFRSVPHLKEFELQEVFKKTKITDKEEIQCIAMSRPDGNKLSEGMFVASLKEVNIHPMAYGDNTDDEAPLETVKIFTTTTCNINIESEAAKTGEVERVEDLSIEGIVFRGTGENTSVVTTVTSTPGTGWFHKMLCEDLPIIDEKGDLNEYYLEMLKMQMRAFHEYSKAMEAGRTQQASMSSPPSSSSS